MIERYIQYVAVERPPELETAAEARVRLGAKFPRTAVRRMTHLGLLIGSVLDGQTPGPEDALVYATTYAETRALEDYLTGFPAASPLLFQTSIHPGGVQQVLVGRQQPLARLWPLAGRTRLVEQALLTALLEPAARVFVVGGEERGTWMLEQGMAAARPFAFALVAAREAAGAIGRVAFVPDAAAKDEVPPSLEVFADALARRENITWSGAGGNWAVTWL
ncbi:MAG: hypothetical protein JSS11_01355 [Verrucomicrobia bacterium]|nr:hypothetical protein [Verrucomicrobiota bacterium]